MSPTDDVSLVNRPGRGTWRYRRNCSLRLEDGALVATDRRKRETRVLLNGGPQSPVAHLSHFRTEPNASYYVDGNGDAVIKVVEPARWDPDTEFAMAKAAGLRVDSTELIHPVRADGVVLDDAQWAEPRYVFAALGFAQFIVALAKLGVLEIMPWLLVVITLDVYALVALFSGRYFGSGSSPTPGPSDGKRSRPRRRGSSAGRANRRG